MSINKKVKGLTSTLFFIPKENKELAKQVIGLYEKRKIKNIATAKSLLTKLSKKLTPNKFKQVELEIKNHGLEHFFYSINFIMWRTYDSNSEETRAKKLQKKNEQDFSKVIFSL